MMIGNSMPVMASSATGLSGKCGDDVSYSYASGILTISGQGAMYDYTANTIPWYSKKDKIKTIRIERGLHSCFCHPDPHQGLFLLRFPGDC